MSDVGNTRGPRRVIVSGGIGSGKTTVLHVLERLGAIVIEADRIGHEILRPGGPAFEPVASRWPQVVVDGHIDRTRLANIVFTDPDELLALEAISHPLIAAEIARRVVAAGDRDVVVEMPVAAELLGPGWTRIVVAAPADLRVERAVARGLDREDVAGSIAAQPTSRQWAETADYVITNIGTVGDLEDNATRVWQELATSG